MCGGAVRHLLRAQLPHWGAGAGLEGQGGAAGAGGEVGEALAKRTVRPVAEVRHCNLKVSGRWTAAEARPPCSGYSRLRRKTESSLDTFGNLLKQPFALPCGDWVSQPVKHTFPPPRRCGGCVGLLAAAGRGAYRRDVGAGGGAMEPGSTQEGHCQGQTGAELGDTGRAGGGQLPRGRTTKAKRLSQAEHGRYPNLPQLRGLSP